MKPRLSKATVSFFGGLEGAAKALQTTPRMIRRWMRLGLSEDGRERLRVAKAVIIKAAVHRRKANSVAKTRGGVLMTPDASS